MQYAATNNIDFLRASADAIDEVSESVTYIGLCVPGTDALTDESWSICRVQKTDTVTLITWANGQCIFNLKFSERANYDYFFKKF